MELRLPNIGDLYRDQKTAQVVMVVSVVLDPDDGYIKVEYELPGDDEVEVVSANIADWFGWWMGTDGLDWPPVRRFELIDSSLVAFGGFESLEDVEDRASRESKLEVLERARSLTDNFHAPLRLVRRPREEKGEGDE